MPETSSAAFTEGTLVRAQAARCAPEECPHRKTFSERFDATHSIARHTWPTISGRATVGSSAKSSATYAAPAWMKVSAGDAFSRLDWRFPAPPCTKTTAFRLENP